LDGARLLCHQWCWAARSRCPRTISQRRVRTPRVVMPAPLFNDDLCFPLSCRTSSSSRSLPLAHEATGFTLRYGQRHRSRSAHLDQYEHLSSAANTYSSAADDIDTLSMPVLSLKSEVITTNVGQLKRVPLQRSHFLGLDLPRPSSQTDVVSTSTTTGLDSPQPRLRLPLWMSI
jgi:hypothetical protein